MPGWSSLDKFGHQDRKICSTWERTQAYFKVMRKKNEMKHMAKFWLRLEVNKLERDAVDVGVVILVDGQALATNLQMVRRTRWL